MQYVKNALWGEEKTPAKDELPPTRDEDILVRAGGSWHGLDMETGVYELRKDNVLLGIVRNKQDKFLSTLRVIYDGKTLYCGELDHNLQLRTHKNTNSMNWIGTENGSLAGLSFVFDDNDEEYRFKAEVAQKMYEGSAHRDFEKAVKESDRDWLYDAYETENMDQTDDSNEESDEFEFGEEISCGADYAKTMDGDDREDCNSSLNSAITRNRTFVVRGKKVAVFSHESDGRMNFIGKIPNIKTMDGETFAPTTALLSKEDSRLLLLHPGRKDTVHALDIPTGKVVEEYKADERVIRSINHPEKYAQTTQNAMLMGISSNAMFMFDSRVADNHVVKEFSYKGKPKLECATTTGSGQVAVGSEKGEIRMYTDLGKRAKTLLPGLGDPIIHVDVTGDGNWILCTTEKYLLVVPTKMPDSDRTGFNVRMGKKKPVPLKLQLNTDDVVKFGIVNVKFTSAHFNTGNNIEEEWIVTSTGPFLITWNFKKVKEGRTGQYQIKKCLSDVVADQFRYGLEDEVVVATPDQVLLQTREKH